jgi:tetratricopeptide (TPR) repeat protein
LESSGGAGGEPGAGAVATSPETAAQLEALGYLAPTGAAPLPDDERELLGATGPDPAALVEDLAALSRAKGLLALQRFEAAQASLRPVRARHPGSGTVAGMLARALAGTGDAEESTALFRRAIVLEGQGCSSLQLDFARALERFGRHREQHEVLAEGLARCPGSGRYRNDTAWALATTPDLTLRDPERALALARSLVVEGEGEPDPNYLDTLAAAFAATGDLTAAAREQRRAIALLERAGARASVVSGYRARAKDYAQRAGEEPAP